ncbi:prephenate dehydrogenase [Nocardioides renjunii]|uniref:prephenate dehydrogenase n=1 Tax=Nocardioides renjunii TaxID=3095075 RepID=UPI002AFEB6A3|nr:prephenate dehydrogenase [Nocardioides sp. S-34]WQQ20480.1 prephenate dehydrogenase [Nocardioides sp. S-34]
MTDDALPALVGPVEVVGAGLIGASVALVCRRLGLDVVLRDTSVEHLRTAHGLGAGRAATPDDRPQLVVVAVPPAAVAEAVVDALHRTDAVVTDVGSVKAAPLASVAARVGPGELARYVGSHPMAGSERSGPLAASAALFDGRPWAVTPHAAADPDAVGLVESLVLECGAAPIRMSPEEHDRAVARISHLPHLAAVLVAGRLAAAPAEHLALSGQGVRDVTRVAASDPALWQQILEANASAVLDLLAEVRTDLDALMTAVAAPSAESGPVTGTGPDLVEILARGNAGTAAIPGKHGGPARPTRSVFVAVPDHPGELARLFGDAGEIGVNIEDVHIDHDPARPVGLTELVVDRVSADRLLAALESRGWTTHR